MSTSRPTVDRHEFDSTLLDEMESNREESLKCLSLAEKYLREGNFEKADKFANKSAKLYPTDKAKGKASWFLRHFS